jgi:hypothetical protein
MIRYVVFVCYQCTYMRPYKFLRMHMYVCMNASVNYCAPVIKGYDFYLTSGHYYARLLEIDYKFWKINILIIWATGRLAGNGRSEPRLTSRISLSPDYTVFYKDYLRIRTAGHRSVRICCFYGFEWTAFSRVSRMLNNFWGWGGRSPLQSNSNWRSNSRFWEPFPERFLQ